MKTLLVDNGSTLIKKLGDLIPGTEVVERLTELHLNTIDTYDVVVLSGSSEFCVTYDPNVFREEKKLIHEFNKGIIGICVGSELIAREFEGELVPLKSGVKGLKKIEVVQDDAIFGDRKEFEAYESHGWAITRLPENFEILAQSDTGIEVFKLKEKPIYAFQFHPENMVEESFGDEIFLRVFEKLTNENKN